MAIGEFQPIDLIGLQGGYGNLPNAANANAIMGQQQQQAATVDALRSRALMDRVAAGQQQQDQARELEYRQAVNEHIANGSPQTAANLIMRFPEKAQQIKSGYELQDNDRREGDLRLKSEVYSRVHNGDYDAAAAVLERYIEADKAAGGDTSDEEGMLQALRSGDPAMQKRVAGILGYDLATLVGPEKWASFHGAKVVNGALVDNTGKALYEAPRQGSYQLKPVLDEDGMETGEWQSVRTDVGTGGLVDSIIGAESGGDPNAQNPNSSASGLGQFTDSTWIETFRSAYPNATLPDSAVLALKTNPEVSRKMTAAYAQGNARALSQAGLPVNPGTVYLSHFAGPAGAQALLKADPNTPVDRILSGEAIAANQSVLGGKTAGEVVSWASGKVSGASQARLTKRFGQAGTGYRWRPDGSREPVPTLGGGRGNREVVALRKEFDALPEVKEFKAIAPIIVSARRAPDTPAGDLQLAYTVGKILDPNSVVRESELAMTIKSGSPLERLLGTGTYVAGQGGRMTPEIRRGLLDMLNERALANRAAYDAARANYEGYARDMGVAPASIIGQHVANAYIPKGGSGKSGWSYGGEVK